MENGQLVEAFPLTQIAIFRSLQSSAKHCHAVEFLSPTIDHEFTHSMLLPNMILTEYSLEIENQEATQLFMILPVITTCVDRACYSGVL